MGNSPWKLLQGTDGNRVRSIRVPGTPSLRHRVDRTLKTEETDAKASAGDVLGFAIQNGICQFKTCRGSQRPRRATSHDLRIGGRNKMVTAASGGRLSVRSFSMRSPGLPGGWRSSNPIQGPASVGLEILTESLILAQDERWRRA